MLETGTRARLRNDPSVIGVVEAFHREIRGQRYRRLHLSDGRRQDFPELQLEPVAAQPEALDDLRAGRWSAPGDLARLLTHVRLTSGLADVIYSMEATNTDFHAYQFKPVVKLLKSETRGLLIADEVGLGKTIEAGLVWTELMSREDARRLLVVCPKSLVPKWVEELRGKFSVMAEMADEQGAFRLLERLRDDAVSREGFAVVASLSALKPQRGWDDDDAPNDGARTQLARLLRDRAGDDPLFDLVVFDEAHHLRNADTQAHRLADLLIPTADYKLLMSATPINLRSADLRNLLKLLDRDLFQREDSFEQLQRENEPLVAARQLALTPSAPLAAVREALRGLESGDLLKTDRRLEVLLRLLDGANSADGPAFRAELAARLEEMSLLGAVVNRTRRRDVNEIQVRRRAHRLPWTMSETERGFYDAVTQEVSRYAMTMDVSDRFLLVSPQRLLASSLSAAFEHWRVHAVDDGLDEETDDRRDEPGPLVARLATLCTDESLRRALRRDDRKYALLRQALADRRGTDPTGKLIVFSSFRRTIDYLHGRLTEEGIACDRLHGSIDEPRQAVLRRFQESEGPRVLLTSEIGGEGLDLQFCRVLINYDLPWNPMKVEQRIGRIDRIGQRSPSIDVLSLLCAGTIEDRVYQRLYARLDLIQRTLGGFEAILGQELAGLEQMLLDPALTADEEAEELERRAVAIENRRIAQDALEEEAAGLIAHGDMILHRIRQAHGQQQWLLPVDVRDYVRAQLAVSYPATRLDRVEPGEEAWDLRFDWDAQLAFRAFVNERHRRFPTQLRRESSEARRILFGKADPRWPRAEAVTATHPLVRWCAALRQAGEDAGAQPRPALIARLSAQASGLPAGRYALAVQHWAVTSAEQQDRLKVAAIALDDGEPIAAAAAEELLRALIQQPYRPAARTAAEAADDIGDADVLLLNGVMARAEREFAEYEAAAHEDRHQTRLAVLRQQRDNEVARVEALNTKLAAENRARIVPANREKLARFVARMDRRIAEAEQAAGRFSIAPPKTLCVALLEVEG